ncbi:sulfotransferase domain-containing protein [Campylobacterota bacterium]
MLIWLASYPRSGNTFTRTVLNQVFGIKTYNFLHPSIRKKRKQMIEKNHKEGIRHTYSKTTGAVTFENEEEFFKNAHSSNELYIVKTHKTPPDDSPAIYIIRNGIHALISYYFFKRDTSFSGYKNIIDLIIGNDGYVNWSEHIKSWSAHTNARPNTLYIRYEDLLNNSDTVIKELEQFFLKFDDGISIQNTWKNPFDTLQKENPKIFRKGKSKKDSCPEFNELEETLFYVKHGEMMGTLGYENKQVKDNEFAFMQNVIKLGDEMLHWKKRASKGQSMIQKLKNAGESGKLFDINFIISKLKGRK